MKDKTIEIEVKLRLDLGLMREQRDYCINEAANASEEEKREIYQGIVNLYDELIEKVLETVEGIDDWDRLDEEERKNDEQP